MMVLLATVVGLLFGFVLQRVGAAHPRLIIDMLRFKNLHLMKAILLAIGLSSLVLFTLLWLGVADASHLSVKSSYVGVIVGGAILGVGWALAGFCPGTAVVASGAGRKDALAFIAGGLLGAFLFTLVYSALPAGLFAKLGGKATLATTGNEKYEALVGNIPGILLAGGIAVVFIAIAFLLPSSKDAE